MAKVLKKLPALSRAQSREIDRIAIEAYGIPGIVLMENAAIACTREALKFLRGVKNPRVAIICGGGNNGGDGYAIARHLRIAGVRVEVCSIVDPAKLTGDAAINRKIVERLELPLTDAIGSNALKKASRSWRRAHLLIDALLGTGFSGELRPHYAEAIRLLNVAGERAKVLSVDLPSGLDCDSGVPANPTVIADLTVTFCVEKIGFQRNSARQFLGRVVVAGIGAPAEIIARVARG